MGTEIRNPKNEIRNKFEYRKRKFETGKRTSFWIFFFVLWICFGFRFSNFGFSAPPSTAPTTAPSHAAQIASWFADLANRDATRRDAARQNLMGLSRDDLPALQALVKNNRPIAPSQAAAMHDIVTQIYLAGEKYPVVDGRPGFLGVSFQDVPPTAVDVGVDDDPHGIVVPERIPGFAGFRYLQNGDVILGATEAPDQPLRSQKDLTQLIGSFKDGDTIHLLIQRAGQTITIGVILSARPNWAPADHPMSSDELHELQRKRLEPADDYWDANFAKYIDESVS